MHIWPSGEPYKPLAAEDAFPNRANLLTGGTGGQVEFSLLRLHLGQCVVLGLLVVHLFVFRLTSRGSLGSAIAIFLLVVGVFFVIFEFGLYDAERGGYRVP